MTLVMTIVWFLIAISILVAIHEFGHFYVARRCGVKVLRFSIGFGPRLLAFTDRKGTEFALSSVPLGGYVKMLDEREGDVAESERHMSYNSKSVQQRIAIAAAGPAANILLAFVVYWAVFMHGTVEYVPVIGNVEPGSPAQHAGLAEGQEILSIDGQRTASRRDVALALINRLGESGEIDIVAKYPGDTLSYQTPVRIERWLRGEEEPDPLAGLGIEFYYPPLGKVIGQVLADSPAERAGFEPGDELIEAAGEEISSWEQWVALVQARPGETLETAVQRGDDVLVLTLVPEAVANEEGKLVGRAGVGVELPTMPEDMRRLVNYNPLDAVAVAARETWDAVGFVFLSLKKLILSEISIKNLSGPIGIAKVAADQAQYGFWAFLAFLAHISVVLAVLNILPIPVLDGGHILFCLVEWVKGSPLSERAQLIGIKAGMALLLCVMVVAFYNDILRL